MSNNPGYVYLPYIIVDAVQVISESDFNPKSLIKYSTQQINGIFYVLMRNKRRINKIDNIYKIKNPS